MALGAGILGGIKSLELNLYREHHGDFREWTYLDFSVLFELLTQIGPHIQRLAVKVQNWPTPPADDAISMGTEGVDGYSRECEARLTRLLMSGDCEVKHKSTGTFLGAAGHSNVVAIQLLRALLTVVARDGF